ncbi:MAG: ATP-binding cassette domain-containing protein [Actinomyces urogenitalis]|uniref:ABC transporter ATP-binding protein n=1 Tax=Actinomyces urogenitalis TaxID=103621 RepID=UPI00290C466A|nr:ATP-binding cassette domain-containing protein [Actinomyces urogenitalis]MDU6150695.1 ATP-binding cassette domain-containing protein [Actinomyces urogenitalis]
MRTQQIPPPSSHPHLAPAAPAAPARRAEGAWACHDAPPAVLVTDLSRIFPLPGRGREKVTAVDGVSLTLPAGSFTALVGASGCGKSTLLQCVAGLDAPSSGTVNLLGTTTSRLRPRAAARFRADHVGFVFQDDNLVTSLSARDNVALPGRLRHRPLPRRAVTQALERVGLGAQTRHLPHEMSGGERQRVAVARVLASCSDIVFADEPTAALDVAAGTEVLRWFRELAGAGTTVLMVTHDASAAAAADSVLVMSAGRIVAALPGGDPQAVSQAVLATRSQERTGQRQGSQRPDSQVGGEAR